MIAAEEPRAERSRAALRFGVLLVAVASPLPFGSVERTALLPLQLGCALLGALAVVTLMREPRAWPRAAAPAFAAIAVWGAVGAVQLVPLPRGWRFPPAASARDALATVVPEVAAASAPWSVSPPDTVDALVRLGAYALLGLATVVGFHRARHLRTAAIVLAASGAFQALYGAAEYLTGRQHILGYAKRYYLDEATGTFINRNHFAGYLAMTLPFALALALPGDSASAPAEGWRKRLLAWAGTNRAAALFGAAAAASIWMGVALSYSRTGLAAAVLATACFLFFARPRRRTLLLALALAAVPIVLLLGREIRAPGERFASLLSAHGWSDGRAVVWRTTARLALEHPILGYGLGTFETAYDPHRSPRAPGRYDHAHNDWLESFCDGGAITLGAGVALLLVSLSWLRSNVRSGPERRGLFEAAAGAALLAVAAHSVTDFGLRIPANALLAAVVIGLQVPRESRDLPPVAAFPRRTRLRGTAP